jgi:lysophospholipase L1-like esterase
VAEPDRWPNQLVARLPSGLLHLGANLAVNGATSRDVIERQVPRLPSLRPGFASLLVGVNDVVQGVAVATYRQNVATILDALLAALPRGRLVVVATPDYTVTPEGARYGDPAERRRTIVAFNAQLEELSAASGVAFVDIFDLSQLARDDRSLVAADGLHPSAAQYRLWVDRAAPVVEGLLVG